MTTLKQQSKTHKPIRLDSLVIPSAYLNAHLSNKINAHAFCVLIQVCAHAKFTEPQAGMCWPSMPRLVALTGLSLCTVRKALSELERTKFIVVVEKGTGRESTHYILPHVTALAAKRSEDKSESKKRKQVQKLVEKQPASGGSEITINNAQHNVSELIQKLVKQQVHAGQCKNEAAFSAHLTMKAKKGIVFNSSIISGSSSVSECLDVTSAIQNNHSNAIGSTRRMRAAAISANV